MDEIRRLPHDDPKLVRLLADDEKTVAATRQKTARREIHLNHNHSDDHSHNHLKDKDKDIDDQVMSIVPSGPPPLSPHGNDDDHDDGDDAVAVRSNEHAMVALEHKNKTKNKNKNKNKAQNNEHIDEDDEVSLPLIGCGTWRSAIATITAATVPSSLDGLIDKQQRQERIKKLQARGDRFITEAERLAMEIPPTRLSLLRENLVKVLRQINEVVKETQEEWYVNSPCRYLNFHMIFETCLAH